MPYATGLPAALAAQGLRVAVVPGAATRGSESFVAMYGGGSVSHWTAGPRRGDRPSLQVCTYGRGKPGDANYLPGPLCNTFLPRGLTVAEQVVHVVACGRANHAGIGGVGGLRGNSSVFGTEAECAGDGDWTEWQRWAYPRINAAYVTLGASSRHIYGHHEWAPTRKIDIRDWPMPAMRTSVLALLTTPAPPPQEDEDLNADEKQMLREIHAALMPGQEKVRHEGDIRQQTRLAKEAAERAAEALQTGHAGVRSAGHVTVMLDEVRQRLRTGPIDVERMAEMLAEKLGTEADAEALAKRVVELTAQRLARPE